MILNEPTAAAMAYGLKKDQIEATKNILVFDLGGGTFDVTVLSIDNGVFKVESSSGDAKLGGQDFDNRLMDFFFEKIKEDYEEDLSKNKQA